MRPSIGISQCVSVCESVCGLVGLWGQRLPFTLPTRSRMPKVGERIPPDGKSLALVQRVQFSLHSYAVVLVLSVWFAASGQ